MFFPSVFISLKLKKQKTIITNPNKVKEPKLIIISKSLEYIFIASSSTISDEHWFIPANDVFAEWKVIQKREEDLEYAVEHYENNFYIITNEGGATNFKIVKTPALSSDELLP